MLSVLQSGGGGVKKLRTATPPGGHPPFSVDGTHAGLCLLICAGDGLGWGSVAEGERYYSGPDATGYHRLNSLRPRAVSEARGTRHVRQSGECDPTRDKLRVDTRLKLLATWNPGRWGDRVQLRHANADGEKIDTTPLVNELLGLLGPGAGGPLSA